MKLLKRLLYRLVHWANYPTPRERLWNMYTLGKAQGQKEALQAMPIAQARPYKSPAVLHWPTGEWRRHWLQGNVTMDVEPLPREEPIAVKDMTPEQIEAVPTIRDAQAEMAAWLLSENVDDPFSDTLERPAYVKAIHQKPKQTA